MVAVSQQGKHLVFSQLFINFTGARSKNKTRYFSADSYNSVQFFAISYTPVISWPAKLVTLRTVISSRVKI